MLVVVKWDKVGEGGNAEKLLGIFYHICVCVCRNSVVPHRAIRALPATTRPRLRPLSANPAARARSVMPRNRRVSLPPQATISIFGRSLPLIPLIPSSRWPAPHTPSVWGACNAPAPCPDIGSTLRIQDIGTSCINVSVSSADLLVIQ